MSFHYMKSENKANTAKRAELIGEGEKSGPGALAVSRGQLRFWDSQRKSQWIPTLLKTVSLSIYLFTFHSFSLFIYSTEFTLSAYSLQVSIPIVIGIKCV